MSYSCNQIENMIEESNALFEYYVERVFESENVSDLISASHWYADAFLNLIMHPTPR